MNPFQTEDLKKVYNRILDFNPFRAKTKEDNLEEKQKRLGYIEELKELSEMAEQLVSDSRYQKLRKLRQEQLNHNLELLKTESTVDPKIATIQARIQTLEEELNMAKVLKEQITKIENEPIT